jgi:hypothetical protein
MHNLACKLATVAALALSFAASASVQTNWMLLACARGWVDSKGRGPGMRGAHHKLMLHFRDNHSDY